MPVVPITRSQVKSVPLKPPDDYILMAAAQMRADRDKDKPLGGDLGPTAKS